VVQFETLAKFGKWILIENTLLQLCQSFKLNHYCIFTCLMTLKQSVYNHYLRVLDEKIVALQQVLNDLKESGTNETKSTAGDKHETALAMLQIEQANKRAQLKEVVDQKILFEKIDPLINTVAVVNGSLIKTNKGYLFLSVAVGKAIIDGNEVIALSRQSPLGAKLMGLKINDVAEVNNVSYLIERID